METVVNWKGIEVEILVYAKKDVDAIMQHVIDMLVLPYKPLTWSPFIPCAEKIELEVHRTRIPIELVDGCYLASCQTYVRVDIPKDDPLWRLAREAVELTWLEAVKRLYISVSPLELKVREWKEGIKPTRITVPCAKQGKASIFEVPLETFEKILAERVLQKKEVEDALKQLKETLATLAKTREKIDEIVALDTLELEWR